MFIFLLVCVYNVWMYVCMYPYVCMCVCVCVYIHHLCILFVHWQFTWSNYQCDLDDNYPHSTKIISNSLYNHKIILLHYFQRVLFQKLIWAPSHVLRISKKHNLPCILGHTGGKVIWHFVGYHEHNWEKTCADCFLFRPSYNGQIIRAFSGAYLIAKAI